MNAPQSPASGTPEQIVASARDEDPDVIGLSILSGSHLALVPGIVSALRAEGVDAPVVVGGIIPEADRPELEQAGISGIFGPGTTIAEVATFLRANARRR